MKIHKSTYLTAEQVHEALAQYVGKDLKLTVHTQYLCERVGEGYAVAIADAPPEPVGGKVGIA